MTTEAQEGKNSQTKKWYRQTGIWAILISAIALVFSQLPPVSSWIPRQSVNLELSKTVGLPSVLGITGFQILIDLKNTGNRGLTLSDLELQVVYPNGIIKTITAESYLKNYAGQEDPRSFPLTSVTLNADERWTEMVVFYPPPSPGDDQEINRLKLQISQSITAKQNARQRNRQNSDVPAEADEKFVSEAREFFNRKFDLTQGIYKASLSCSVNGQKETLKQFEFTVYEYQIKTKRLELDDYRFGYGLLGSGDPTKQVWAVITKSS